jgi:hypothetical protein
MLSKASSEISVELGVPARQAHADVVVQDVQRAPALPCGPHRCLQVGFPRDVSRDCRAVEAFLPDQRCGLFSRFQGPVDREDMRAFAREPHGGGAPIADAFAGTLPGSDDDRYLALQPRRRGPALIPCQ